MDPFSFGSMDSADRLRTPLGRVTIGRLGEIARSPARGPFDRARRATEAAAALSLDDRRNLAFDEIATLSHLAHMWAATEGRTFADADLNIQPAGLPFRGAARDPIHSSTGCALA